MELDGVLDALAVDGAVEAVEAVDAGWAVAAVGEPPPEDVAVVVALSVSDVHPTSVSTAMADTHPRRRRTRRLSTPTLSRPIGGDSYPLNRVKSPVRPAAVRVTLGLASRPGPASWR
jgi:hypothetical protein